MEFFVYDLIFLGVFIIFTVWFLYKNKENLKKEGWMFLYRAKWGMEAIEYIGERYRKALNVIKYFSIAAGFVLMISMIYMLWKNIYIYIKVPQITEIIKAPPIAPLIPYFPKLYGMESFFPPFYFTYFLIALAIVAVTHEFSHGVFMKLFDIKIKSTGFAFFGPFFGAFVEEDKNSFQKKSSLAQMSVLSAGAFANIITAIVFFIALITFFNLSFEPNGYAFNTYTYSILPLNETRISELIQNNLTSVFYDNKTYYIDSILKKQIKNDTNLIIAYNNAPAINAGLKGIIIKIDESPIRNQKDMQKFMEKTKPGQKVLVKTIIDNKDIEYNISLAINPANNSIGYLGVGFISSKPSSGLISRAIFLINFKEPSTYYTPKYDGNFVYFIYYLIWWIALISALVGLFNMLPLGILDGGRFFYLTMLSITKSKKFSGVFFKIVSGIILFAFLLLTFIWLVRLF